MESSNNNNATGPVRRKRPKLVVSLRRKKREWCYKIPILIHYKQRKKKMRRKIPTEQHYLHKLWPKCTIKLLCMTKNSTIFSVSNDGRKKFVIKSVNNALVGTI